MPSQMEVSALRWYTLGPNNKITMFDLRKVGNQFICSNTTDCIADESRPLQAISRQNIAGSDFVPISETLCQISRLCVLPPCPEFEKSATLAE